MLPWSGSKRRKHVASWQLVMEPNSNLKSCSRSGQIGSKFLSKRAKGSSGDRGWLSSFKTTETPEHVAL